MDNYKSLFKGKNIMVTGGLGSIGTEIVNQLLNTEANKVIVIDNRETGIFYQSIKLDADNRIRYFLCDIRDKTRLMHLSKNIDIIFHAAALKHVIICEYNPIEAVQTNIIGTQNIIECAIENQVDRFILISTDKAVNPTNLMGSTKLAAERLVSSMSLSENSMETKFGVVRFGNVLASRGSVLEIWNEYISSQKNIPITDPNMTRFFMSIPESVNLIFKTTRYASVGEIFIFKMPSIKIGGLAKAYLKLKGLPETSFDIIGQKTGEKMYEDLLIKSDSAIILEDNDVYVKLPILINKKMETKLINQYEEMGFKISNIENFSSEDKNVLISQEKIMDIIKNYI